MRYKAKFVSNYDFFKISIAQHYKDKDFSHYLLLKKFVRTDLPSYPPDPVIKVVAEDAGIQDMSLEEINAIIKEVRDAR